MKPLDGFRRVHLVGIGGAGMSSLAEVMHAWGFTVSGSDLAQSPMTDYLVSLGISVAFHHRGSNLGDAESVIRSSAVNRDNPEIREAFARGIPVVRRAEMLGEIMKKKQAIAVCGTHGKTTTTLMLGAIWRRAGLDVTVMGGGVPQDGRSGTIAGGGDYLIAEADEFDRSFLAMYPSFALVTNIDNDHLDCYENLDDVRDAFVNFCGKVPFYGFCVLNSDDPGSRSILGRLNGKVLTYGLKPDAEYRARILSMGLEGSRFEVSLKGTVLTEVDLRLRGEHNISNALGAFALSHNLGVSCAQIRAGLGEFRGVKRRLEDLGEIGGIRFYDDYAHHPAEIRASLAALRNVMPGRLVVVFQPHLFSRTRILHQQMARALLECDSLFVLPVYAARETPAKGVDGNLISEEAIEAGHGDVRYLEKPEEAVQAISASLKPGDSLLTMGAGDVHTVAHAVKKVKAEK